MSLHILDIAENSVNAGARNVEIAVTEDVSADVLSIEITDDGRGMEPEGAERAADPFYTTKTAKRVGLGLPLLKQAAAATGGTMEVRSQPGGGTTVRALFHLSHIDRAPLGDMAATLVMLVAGNPEVRFRYRYEHKFTFDTSDLKALVQDVSLSSPETLAFIREYIAEHMRGS